MSPAPLTPPSLDQWLQEAQQDPSAAQVGMYLIHSGVVRATPRAEVRQGVSGLPPVTAVDFSYDPKELDAAVADTLRMDGIFYVRTWLNQGTLSVGETLMRVLVGGDIRPHVVDALQYLVGRIKSQCVSEREISVSPLP